MSRFIRPGIPDSPLIDEAHARALLEDRHPAPQQVLGLHEHGGVWQIGLLLPGALQVTVLPSAAEITPIEAIRIHQDGVFLAVLPCYSHYRLQIRSPDGERQIADAQAFPSLLTPAQLEALKRGDSLAQHLLGAHPTQCQGEPGVRFAVWAPQASRVSVVGDFNAWDPRRHPMHACASGGLWELFIPEARCGDAYQYRLVDAQGHPLPLKTDPMARQSKAPPCTAALVPAPWQHRWHDEAWMASRGARLQESALSIYELHSGSWRRHPDGRLLNWDDLADQLIPYVRKLGFTHLELLPIAEHPFGGSWGYQPLGIYAPTARYGPPEAFARFVDRCHQAGLGVILDWVSAHFPADPHGLARFDGTPLYEYADIREGWHAEWNTLIYNYGRPQVRAYLIGSALEWLDRYHLDGLRIDAVTPMLYRNYGRAPGEWIPNHLGGPEHLEAVAFLKALNSTVRQRHPDVLMIAEESTSWPKVTAPVEAGGLGFTHKWNFGWMNDTLAYMGRAPDCRSEYHTELNFGILYAYSERFILPLSHDEVAPGKSSLIGKMAGSDDWQRFAHLRAYYGFMWAYPGGKLLFMGGELATWETWDHDRELDWHLLDRPPHQGIQRLIADLNRLLRSQPALHRCNDSEGGFAWMIADDCQHSVYAFVRLGREGDPPLLVICNFTPVVHYDYPVGVPYPGHWIEQLNSDAACYGGSNLGNDGGLESIPEPCHDHAQHLRLTLPPLATLYLSLKIEVA